MSIAKQVTMQVKVVIDGHDLDKLAEFWCAALGYELLDVWHDAYRNLRPRGVGSASGPPLVLQQVPETKAVKNRLHLDLHPDDGPAAVERLLTLGATRVGELDVEFLTEHATAFQVMADPEGNEFCVVWRTRPAARDLPSSAVE
jgi:hypothetical protein